MRAPTTDANVQRERAGDDRERGEHQPLAAVAACARRRRPSATRTSAPTPTTTRRYTAARGSRCAERAVAVMRRYSDRATIVVVPQMNLVAVGGVRVAPDDLPAPAGRADRGRPTMIVLLGGPAATSPQSSRSACTDASGLVRPSRFRSPTRRQRRLQPGERRLEQRQQPEPRAARRADWPACRRPRTIAPLAGASTPPTSVLDTSSSQAVRRHLARRPEVHAARAGAHQAAVRHVGRAALQRQLHLRRRHARRALQQQRDAAADHRRRHAGAAQLHVGVGAAAGDVQVADTLRRRYDPLRLERDDLVAGRGDVRLDGDVVLRRAARAVGRHAYRRYASAVPQRVERADGDRVAANCPAT